VGITSLDVIHRVTMAPPRGRKSVSGAVELSAGGPAANAAVTCAALLGSATLVTAIGDGPLTTVVREDLAAHHVRVIDLADTSTHSPNSNSKSTGYAGWQLPVASIVVEPDGIRTVVAPGATNSTLALTPAARAAVSAADAILLDGHHPVAAAEALSLAHPKAITILDAGSVKPLVQPWIPQLSVVAASADYAAALDLTPDQAVDDLIAQGTRAALVTTGPGPVRWRTAYGSSGVVQPPQVRAVDTLGAGDAFHGALLAALVQSPSLSSDFGYAVERAVRVASLRVAHVSARSWLTHLPGETGWTEASEAT